MVIVIKQTKKQKSWEKDIITKSSFQLEKLRGDDVKWLARKRRAWIWAQVRWTPKLTFFVYIMLVIFKLLKVTEVEDSFPSVLFICRR